MPYTEEEINALKHQEAGDSRATLDSILRSLVTGGMPEQIEATIHTLLEGLNPLVTRDTANYLGYKIQERKAEELEQEVISLRDRLAPVRHMEDGDEIEGMGDTRQWDLSNQRITAIPEPSQVRLNFISEPVMKAFETKLTQWILDSETNGDDVAEFLIELIKSHR